MTGRDDDPQQAIVAAEVAVADGDLDRAVAALHEALSRVRKQRYRGDEA